MDQDDFIIVLFSSRFTCVPKAFAAVANFQKLSLQKTSVFAVFSRKSKNGF